MRVDSDAEGQSGMAASLQIQLDSLGLSAVSDAWSRDSSDKALVEAAQNGDRAAFGALYRRYARMVHGILLARVPRIAAEDLLHDVFLQAMPRITSLHDGERFGAWISVIARNRAIDYYRRNRLSVELDEQQAENQPEPASARREQLLEGLVVLEAIRNLPEAYRETLIMRFVEGMNGPEIAARTGLKPGSVRVNLHRGLEMLRAKLSAKTGQKQAPQTESSGAGKGLGRIEGL
jgi:RNA polymerase sigma-70 factor (ECF subfamily)